MKKRLTIKDLTINFGIKTCQFLFEHTFFPGQMVYVTGPSGSGKTTLLTLIGLMQKPSSGEWIYNQKRLMDLTENQKADFRKDKIGFLFQEYHLIQELTPLENVMLPLMLKGETEKESKKVAIDYVRQLNIDHERVSKWSQRLSGGEKQRLLLARTLIKKPEIVLIDEPAVHLDQENKQRCMDMIMSYIKKEQAIGICATHDKALIKNAEEIIKVMPHPE